MRWWRREGEPDLLQLSGGEPTIHPQILEIIAAAKRRPIRHIMLNTNGIRIAQEPEFVKQLAAFKPGFEVYLQFEFAEALRFTRPCAAPTSRGFAGKRWKPLNGNRFRRLWWWW